ncbi:hypothetical protein [Tumebacillus flagellatus]|uniref:Copper resistance protein D domain-containing protein n=1 Tax=Tumebacillus flagellatus TaxID=1157490 RepID=A0A074LWU8_9BACL|nr:hypothetical protein [Tumebacillus flagellatus]KEO84568.1 hypothetical protein EL26_03355 [Tumebacillus flagellatus]
MTLFTIILVFHLLAVVVKLGVLFYIPRLKTVEQVQSFLAPYKKIDRAADITLWVSAVAMILTAGWQILLQLWLLVSMLIYALIFIIVKKVILGRMNSIVETNKVFAREEMSKLRFENACVIITAVGLFGAIGYLMANKPF